MWARAVLANLDGCSARDHTRKSEVISPNRTGIETNNLSKVEAKASMGSLPGGLELCAGDFDQAGEK
jgi:hypothetical protein